MVMQRLLIGSLGTSGCRCNFIGIVPFVGTSQCGPHSSIDALLTRSRRAHGKS